MNVKGKICNNERCQQDVDVRGEQKKQKTKRRPNRERNGERKKRNRVLNANDAINYCMRNLNVFKTDHFRSHPPAHPLIALLATPRE